MVGRLPMSATELSRGSGGMRAVQGSYLQQAHASDPRAGCSTSSVQWRAAGAAHWRTAPPDCPPAHTMTHQPARVRNKDEVQQKLIEVEEQALSILQSNETLQQADRWQPLHLLSRPVSGDDECRLNFKVTVDVAALRINVQAATDRQLTSVRCRQMTWACCVPVLF